MCLVGWGSPLPGSWFKLIPNPIPDHNPITMDPNPNHRTLVIADPGNSEPLPTGHDTGIHKKANGMW